MSYRGNFNGSAGRQDYQGGRRNDSQENRGGHRYENRNQGYGDNRPGSDRQDNDRGSEGFRGGRGGSGGRGGFRGGRGGDEGRSNKSSSRSGVAPIAKKDLPFNSVVFAKRPPTQIQQKKLGTKLDVYTNHAEIRLPQTTIVLYTYNIEVMDNRNALNKREEASPVFWRVFEETRTTHQLKKENVVFNDVNTLFSTQKILSGFGRLTPRRADGKRPRYSVNYKYTGTVDFGANADLDQQDELLATVADAIVTSRARHPDEKLYTVFKRNIFLVHEMFNDKNVGGVKLSTPIYWGLEGKMGISFAIKMNLRAGITTCFDLNHTLFSKPGYPLIRLLIELIDGAPMSDEDYETVWDDRLRDVHPDEKNKALMTKILSKMTLTYCVHTALGMDYAKQKSAELAAAPAETDRRLTPREFPFKELGDSAERELFEQESQNGGPSRIVSVAEYYRDTYQITLRYPNLPVVYRKTKKNGKRVAFPMEMVSYVANPKRYEGFAPPGLLAQLVQDTTYTPDQRKMILEKVISQQAFDEETRPLIDNEDSYMKLHQLKIEDQMLQSKATLLPPPTVVYGNSEFTDSEHSGEWEAVRNEPVRTILIDGAKQRKGSKEKVVVGSIIGIRHPINPEKSGPVEIDTLCYERIMRALVATGQKIFWHNEELQIPDCLDKFDYNPATMKPQEMYKYINSVKQHVETDARFQHEDFIVVPVFFLIFDQRCSNYNDVPNEYNLLKHLCDNMLGVYTQGMLVDNFNTVSENFATCRFTCHIVEKILGKIGTTHRELKREGSHKTWTKLTDPKSPTLVLGIDVSHPKTSNRKPSTVFPGDAPAESLSVASVVGNIDFNMTQFRSSPRVQDAGEEQIVRMEEQVMARFEEFISNTGERPAHLVIYRDGLCEGDFKRIMYEELNAVESACKSIANEYTPTITYILVSKRHRTKFFPVNPDESYEKHANNVKPGTLVEDVVTSTKYFDFFLASQIGQEGTGTVKPTHYYVLHDTWAPMDSFWQTITHAFTYNFCRTTTTIALPAPVMYAHLAAKRAKETFDAALYCEEVQGNRIDVNRFEDITKLNGAIRMHTQLDGMVFV